jgi:hypothetical protein
MNKTANGSDLIEYRRRLIARLLIRKPNITRRELHMSLATPDETGQPRILNPDTGEPYSLGTIQNDIDWLKADWRAKSGQDYDDWVAGELAKLDELEAVAWRVEDVDAVLKCMARRAKLKGLDAPTTSKAQNLNIDLAQLNDHQLQRIANGEDPIRVIASDTGGGGS